MERRDFLKFAAGAVASSALVPALAASPESIRGRRQVYEHRQYRLGPGSAGELLQRYLQKGLLPALRTRSIGPVGVFTQTDPAAAVIHVVIPYTSLEEFALVAAGLDNDPAVRAAVPDYFSRPTKAEPAYDRMDSTLLLAMAGQPQLVLPAASASGAPRLFEIRTYESFSEERNLKKVEMFNSGEMAVQRDAGLAPVFYGLALAGPNLPRVVYMLSGADRATHKRNWSRFSHDPRWLAMKANPDYANTATHNVSIFVAPTMYSQI